MVLMDVELQKAYQSGRYAFIKAFNHTDYEQNPYVAGTVMFQNWQEGYNDAMEEFDDMDRNRQETD